MIGTIGSIGITDEHLELHASVRRWVEAHVRRDETKAAIDAEHQPGALPPFWGALLATGWTGLHIGEKYGGEGFGLSELAVVLEELGRACAPGPFLPTVIASSVVQALGSDEQKAEWLPTLADGSLIGAVVIPPGEAVAVPCFDGSLGADGALTISGSIRPVLGGGEAGLVVAPVRVVAGDEHGGSAPSTVWCLIDASDTAVQVTPLRSTDPTRGVAQITLDALVVGPDGLLPPVDGSVGSVGSVVADIAAAVVAAESVGGSAWCVETAAEYACQRVQFGRPIGQFQSVKHRCAAMLLALEQARAAAWDACRISNDPNDSNDSNDGNDLHERALSACVAGALVPDAFFEVSKDCIQVLGGIGYTWEHDAHLYIKRATALRQLMGAPAAWRMRIARAALVGTRRSVAVALPPEAEPMRDEVRAFIRSTKAKPKAEWTASMADAGYLVPYWPAPWGRGASPLEQLVIDEAFDEARLRRPHLQVGAWVLPTLIAHGTPEQQERWVRPTLHGKILWCQLFSEPEAGSDLASLTTKAVRDDERRGWVVNGQKVWTTMAHSANWGILLARTDPSVPKHQGITCFVLDMSSPGIEIRPLRELTGAEMFNEVFFTDVFVPDDCVVGAVNEGWEAARTTLANERVSMGSGSSFGPGVEAVLAMVNARGRADDRGVLDEVGALVADGQAIAMMGLRMTLKALGGATPGAEASVRKLLSTEHEQHVQEVGLALLGQEAAIAEGDAAAWIGGFLGNRALSIAGGTSDIQRNVVAERLLGLPKDPEVSDAPSQPTR